MMTLPSDLTNDQLRTLVLKLQRENTRLAELLAQARQARFGRKAENFSPAQLSLLDEDSETDISALSRTGKSLARSTTGYGKETQTPGITRSLAT